MHTDSKTRASNACATSKCATVLSVELRVRFVVYARGCGTPAATFCTRTCILSATLTLSLQPQHPPRHSLHASSALSVLVLLCEAPSQGPDLDRAGSLRAAPPSLCSCAKPARHDEMQAARSAAVQMARQAPGQQVRNMSGHGTPAENARWMQFWTYTTYAALPVLLGVGAYNASQHHAHHGAHLLV